MTLDLITCYWRDLSALAEGIIPTKLPVQPTSQDVLKFRGDLEILCRKVDRLVEAYGAHAAEHLHSIDRALFRNQLSGALEGNAFFDLERAADCIAEEMEAAE